MGFAAGLLSVVAAAQDTRSDLPRNGALAAPGLFEEFGRQQEERQARLREQLADPKRRERVPAERTETVRANNPDLARVLRLDPQTEAKLVSLLAEEALAVELEPILKPTNAVGPLLTNGAVPYNPLRGEADRYTQRMQKIREIIGPARLDAYVDYESLLGFRMQVARFDAVLPGTKKLRSLQFDALTRSQRSIWLPI